MTAAVFGHGVRTVQATAAELERLGRYEIHLDRKLERMLTMLLRLKELRRAAVEG